MLAGECCIVFTGWCVAARWGCKVGLLGGCCKVGAATRWVLLQGGCYEKVGAVTRWVLLQGGWCCQVVLRQGGCCCKVDAM